MQKCTAEKMTFAVSADPNAIDLKKKRRAAVRKSIFNDLEPALSKGLWGQDWCDKFIGTDMYVPALELFKKQRHNDRIQDEIYAKWDVSWDEREKMSPVQRAKRQQKKDSALKNVREARKKIERDKLTLEDRLIDHRIAEAKAHQKAAKMAKADNTVDMDVDPGFTGVGGYGGQMAMRVKPNPKCNGCTHYDVNMGACQMGLVPDVCGDGSYPEIGYAPAQGNRIAAKNWTLRHKGAVANAAQAEDVGYEAGEVPYRVEVLGEGPLALSVNEKMTLLKSLQSTVENDELVSPEEHAQWLTDQLGFRVSPPLDTSVLKGRMSISEFADAMGTTEEVVRSIARQVGDKYEFKEFVKSKLPDIAVAHGLTETDMGRLYRAAIHTVKSMSPTEWETWKGVNFEDVEDETLARAIEQHGLLDRNGMMAGGIVTPAEPQSRLPEPEPISESRSVPVAGFVGGNLHLADSLSRR